MTRGPKLITEETKNVMRNILKDVQNGNFAKEWIEENEKGTPNLKELRKQNTEHSIEKVGKNLREMMSWLFNKK